MTTERRPSDLEYLDQRRAKVNDTFLDIRAGRETQREAAKSLGIGLNRFVEWESGFVVPPHEKRQAISRWVYKAFREQKNRFIESWTELSGAWGFAPIAEAEWDVHDLASRHVSRPELRDLLSDWQSVISTRTPRIRFVEGDHGAGKTTLVNRLVGEVVHGNAEAIVAVTRCPELPSGEAHGLPQRTSYSPLKELMSEVVQQQAGPWLREGKASLVLNDMVIKAPAWRSTILDGFRAALRPCADEEDPRQPATYPERTKNAQYLALLHHVRQRPVLLCIDNLQWADLSSLKLLLGFIQSCIHEQSPVYLLGTFGYFEAHQPGAPESPFRRFYLEATKSLSVYITRIADGIGVGEFLGKRYPGCELPTCVHELTELATRGNPWLLNHLFQTLEGLGEPQRLPKDQFLRLMDNWQDFLRNLISGAPAEQNKSKGTLPGVEELRARIGDAILELRFDRMQRISMRALLDQASVEWSVTGQGFTVEVLTKALEMDEPYVYTDLGDLEHKYLLIRARPQTSIEARRFTLYEFWYWLYGSYIYQRVDPDYQPRLHLLIAECLSVLYAGSPTISGILARHFARGKEPLQAASHALEAARHEAGQSGWAAVTEWCKQGLEWLEGSMEQEATQIRLGLFYELAQSYYRNGDYNHASEAFRGAIVQAEIANADPSFEARLWAWLAESEEERSEFPSARRAVKRGKNCLRKHRVPAGEVSLWLDTLHGLLLCRADKLDQAISALQKVIADGESLPQDAFSDFVRVRTYNCLGIALSCMDRYSESCTCFRKGLEVASRLGDWAWQADLKTNLAEDDVYDGQLEEAEKLLTEALDHAKEARDSDSIAWAGGILGNMYLESGRPTEAKRCLAEATGLLEKTGNNKSQPTMYADLALAHLALSECDQAQAIARRARQWGRSRRARGYWLDALAQIEAGCSKPIEKARLHFEQAIELLDEAGARQFGARSRRNFARFLAKTGEPQRARELLEDALVTFRDLALPLEVARTEQLLEDLGEKDQ